MTPFDCIAELEGEPLSTVPPLYSPTLGTTRPLPSWFSGLVWLEEEDSPWFVEPTTLGRLAGGGVNPPSPPLLFRDARISSQRSRSEELRLREDTRILDKDLNSKVLALDRCVTDVCNLN